jgi:hypothetical protein
MQDDKTRVWRLVGLLLVLIPYLLYTILVIRMGRGPIDYRTFVKIGQRLLDRTPVYDDHSYYPMPYVMVFALFSWLPWPIDVLLWLLLPVFAVLVVSGWSPYALMFAPTFGHFVGGQSAVFGLLGLWGYRRNSAPDNIAGGVWLGLTTMKPQLGLIPCAWAVVQWWKAFRRQKRIPPQAWAYVVTMLLLYLPGFVLIPDWPWRWLSQSRPLFERPMAGFIPRTLLLIMSPRTTLYWVIWIATSIALLFAVWFFNERQLSLDVMVLWSFVVSPLVHDYDLIQLLPLLETVVLQRAAVLLSMPGLLVILAAYDSTRPWYVFTIIAPGLLWLFLRQRQNERKLLRHSQESV